MPKQNQRISNDDGLMISYTIKHQEQVLESVAAQEAIGYQMGTGQWPIQLELAMLGEQAGARLRIEVRSADNVFGSADPDRIVTMDRVDFASPPQPGELVEFALVDEQGLEGQVLSVFGDKIEVDFNHPYVGRDLIFDIHIHSIV